MSHLRCVDVEKETVILPHQYPCEVVLLSASGTLCSCMTYFCPWFRGFRCLYKADIELESVNNVGVHSGADPGFVGLEVFTIFGAIF